MQFTASKKHRACASTPELLLRSHIGAPCRLHVYYIGVLAPHFQTILIWSTGSGSGRHSHSSHMSPLETIHSVYGLMTLSLEDALESTTGVALLSPDGVDALAFSIAELATRVPRFD